MKPRTIETDLQEGNLIAALKQQTRPYTVVVGEPPRSPARNSAYWCTVGYLVDKIQFDVKELSDMTGYNPVEVRDMIGEKLLPRHASMLFAITPEAVHAIIKGACNIPTSTRLGTKKFNEFSDITEAYLQGTLDAVQEAINLTKREIQSK